MDRKRCSEKHAETSEGKTTILQAEFDESGTRVPNEVGGDSRVTFSVDICGYKIFLIRSSYAKVMAV